MRIAQIFVLLLSAATVAFGQKSETRKTDAFKGIKASEAVSVVLKKGDKESIKVEVEGVPLDPAEQPAGVVQGRGPLVVGPGRRGRALRRLARRPDLQAQPVDRRRRT